MKIRDVNGVVRDLTAEEEAQRQADQAAAIARKQAIEDRIRERDTQKQLTLALLQPTEGPIQIGTIFAELNIVKAYLRKLVEDDKI